MRELLLVSGHLIDPLNQIDGIMDVRIIDGRIAEVGPSLSARSETPRIDASDRLVMPGIVDSHVHLSHYFGNSMGHRMLAKAGVTTALDMAGDVNDLLAGMENYGAGLTIGYLKPIIPGDTIDSEEPSRGEIARFVDRALEEGAYGIKILGGHYPLTPKATQNVLEECDRRGVHVAFHAGTTEQGSTLEGVREALELAGGRRFHLPHINSYCRGATLGEPLVEAMVIVRLLAAQPSVQSESYMAAINGTEGFCADGIPKSNVTKTLLKRAGYPPTMAGLEAAILDGVVQVQVCTGGEVRLLSGREAVVYWKDHETWTGISFNVNPADVTMYLATVKVDGQFAVHAFATDGGGIPRNTTLEQGLALVKYGAITLREFVSKATCNGAKLLRMPTKGHLGVGADADVVVVNAETARSEMTIAMGVPIMVGGVVVGTGGLFFTTASGASALRARGASVLAA